MVKHEYIKKSLLAFKKVMDQYNIPFWLEYGTQLGAVRDGKIIPWDLDGDVGVWWKHIPAMKEAEKDFKMAGIYLAYQPSHIYINLKMPDGTWLLTVDVYTFKQVRFNNEDWIVRIENGELQDVRSPAQYYFTFKYINFLGDRFLVPIMPEKALEFAYGPEWKTPIKKPGIQIVYGNGKLTPKQLNKMGRTHHMQLEDIK